MKLRVWLDDTRPIRAGFNVRVTTASEAIRLLESGDVELISLDHDLHPDHYTAYCHEFNGAKDVDYGEHDTGLTVAEWIAEAVKAGKIPKPEVRIHTLNEFGRGRMLDKLAAIGVA